jgi:2-methylcitrate dehydratase PrpD
LEAKFSAKYAVATALFNGEAGLSRFTNEAMRQPGLAEELRRVDIVEDAAQQSGNDIQMGEVRLRILDGADRELGRFVRSTIPGSPASPPSRAALGAKFAECLAVFERVHGETFPVLDSIAKVEEAAAWLPSGVSTERVSSLAAQANRTAERHEAQPF